jgi:6-pyruvoyltetrahydropterin/6-carboxytetrahydropterin synthase
MIRLTREVRFSVDRDWAGRVDPAHPITNSWGGWPSAVGLVPYLRARLTISGEPDAVTGYLCNIKVLDRLVRDAVIPLAAEELHQFGWRLAPERLCTLVWGKVADLRPDGATLERFELLATPFLRYAVDRKEPTMVEVTQQFEFAAAHRLHCPKLSDGENVDVFGKCNNPNGHGHNYVVEVSVRGVPDSQTGSITPLPKFEAAVRDHVIDRLDHKHLNDDTVEFAEVNPTVENIAKVVWGLLDGRLPGGALSNVRVYETPKTWADYAGS